MVPGRHVARAGEKSETPGVELEPADMEALIAKDLNAWHTRVKALHEAGLAALQAIDAKDAQKVFEVGEQIERACEGCHSQYWYPNEKIPPLPGSAGHSPPGHLRAAHDEVAGTSMNRPRRATAASIARLVASVGRTEVEDSTTTDRALRVRLQLPASRPSMTR
jgi:hypothetical protein